MHSALCFLIRHCVVHFFWICKFSLFESSTPRLYHLLPIYPPIYPSPALPIQATYLLCTLFCSFFLLLCSFLALQCHRRLLLPGIGYLVVHFAAVVGFMRAQTQYCTRARNTLHSFLLPEFSSRSLIFVQVRQILDCKLTFIRISLSLSFFALLPMFSVFGDYSLGLGYGYGYGYG